MFGKIKKKKSERIYYDRRAWNRTNTLSNNYDILQYIRSRRNDRSGVRLRGRTSNTDDVRWCTAAEVGVARVRRRTDGALTSSAKSSHRTVAPSTVGRGRARDKSLCANGRGRFSIRPLSVATAT